MSIELADVEFLYDGVCIIKKSSACFGEGLVHLVVGRTGSGKTTLSYLIAGLIRPTSGKVVVDNVDPSSKDFDRQLLQIAFQFPEEQIFAARVEDEIGFGPRNFGLKGGELEDRVAWAADVVGLGLDLLKRSPSDLSFGERRKVALASVIALKPRYLLLDEPFAGLDLDSRRGLISTISDLTKEGMTLLIFTHEVDVASQIGDMITPIDCGKILGSYQPLDFFEEIEDECLLPLHIVVARNLIKRGWQKQKGMRSVDQVAEWVIEGLQRNSRGR